MDFISCAALGLAGAAAITAVDAAELKPSDNVLVTGATGGVGNQVVQLATEAGAHVIATAGTADEQALVTDLGAATVDYLGDVTATIRSSRPDGAGYDRAARLLGVAQPLWRITGGRFFPYLQDRDDRCRADTMSALGEKGVRRPSRTARA